jgi:DNA-binding MarR family transcriptional regulator
VDQDLFDDVLAMLAGLNRTDMRCLDIVGQQGPMTAGDLASAARLTSGAITAVLDRLEARGLVRRVRDTADRRRVLVEVAADLDELSAPVFGPFLEDAQRKLDTYSDREMTFLLRFLRDNREVLASHTGRLHELLAEREAESGEQAAS